jgi:hypothetical protein
MTGWMIISIVLVVVAIFATGAAYRNGVADGYGYSREPNNPGYKKAGWLLKKYSAHRWPELKGEAAPPGSPPKPNKK